MQFPDKQESIIFRFHIRFLWQKICDCSAKPKLLHHFSNQYFSSLLKKQTLATLPEFSSYIRTLSSNWISLHQVDRHRSIHNLSQDTTKSLQQTESRCRASCDQHPFFFALNPPKSIGCDKGSCINCIKRFGWKLKYTTLSTYNMETLKIVIFPNYQKGEL